MASIGTELVNSLWFILPAYLANASPVVLGGGRPLDFGRSFPDKRRIFGDGKTWRGFVGGILVGVIVGIIQGIIYPYISLNAPANNLTVFPYGMRAVLLSIGALLGDISGSFVKRRINLKRGAPFPVMDQIGFLVFAFIITAWRFSVPMMYVIILLPLTFFAHLISNIAAYWAGLKTVWY